MFRRFRSSRHGPSIAHRVSTGTALLIALLLYLGTAPAACGRGLRFHSRRYGWEAPAPITCASFANCSMTTSP